MRKPLAALAVISSVGLASAGAAAQAQTLEDGTTIGAPLVHKNLSILPLYAAAPPGGEEYLVLDEGMDRGEVKIVERGEGGSVNELVIDNRSQKPLFLMSGEVILGGQQDRIIGKDTIVPPRQKKEIPVFCVEHGRWSGADKSFRSAKAMAHTKLRKQASYAQQGDVWNEVAAKNKARKTENATDTYRRVATEDGATGDAKGYEAAIGGALARLDGRDRLVGLAVAVNGQVVAIEQFATAKLFAKVSPKILRSYYVEAVDVPVVKVDKAATAADVVAFAAKEREAAKAAVLQDGRRKTERLSGKGVEGTVVIDAEDANAKPVYKSLHAH